MSRKDYEAIAAMLAGELAVSGTDAERHKVRGIALSLADILARDNPRFDRARFYRAAGIAGTAGDEIVAGFPADYTA